MSRRRRTETEKSPSSCAAVIIAIIIVGHYVIILLCAGSNRTRIAFWRQPHFLLFHSQRHAPTSTAIIYLKFSSSRPSDHNSELVFWRVEQGNLLNLWKTITYYSRNDSPIFPSASIFLRFHFVYPPKTFSTHYKRGFSLFVMDFVTKFSTAAWLSIRIKKTLHVHKYYLYYTNS